MFGIPSMNLLEIEHPGGASMHVSAGGATKGRVGRVGLAPSAFCLLGVRGVAEGTYGGVSAVSNVDEKWGPIRGVEPFGSAFGRPALKIGSCSLACTSV